MKILNLTGRCFTISLNKIRFRLEEKMQILPIRLYLEASVFKQIMPSSKKLAKATC